MEGLRVAHQLVDTHPLRQLVFLGQITDTSQHAHRVANRVEAEDAHRAARGAQQAEQVLEERGLACTVGTDEAVDLACRGAERYAGEGWLFPERPREVGDIDDWLFHLHFSHSCRMPTCSLLSWFPAARCCSHPSPPCVPGPCAESRLRRSSTGAPRPAVRRCAVR